MKLVGRFTLRLVESDNWTYLMFNSTAFPKMYRLHLSRTLKTLFSQAALVSRSITVENGNYMSSLLDLESIRLTYRRPSKRYLATVSKHLHRLLTDTANRLQTIIVPIRSASYRTTTLNIYCYAHSATAFKLDSSPHVRFEYPGTFVSR